MFIWERAATNYSYYSAERYQHKFMFNGTMCYDTKHPTRPDLTQFPEVVPY